MQIEGYSGESWVLDEDLRSMARDLIAEYPDEIGYIDLDKVIFARCNDSKKTEGMGKCTRMGPAIRLVPHYMANLLGVEVDEERLDIRYIIVINTEAIGNAGGDAEKMTWVTLFHELKHIDEDMEKLVKHDIKDFGSILKRFGVFWTVGAFKDSVDDGVEDSD